MNTERQENALARFHMNISDQIYKLHNPQKYLAYPSDVVKNAACKTMGITLEQFMSGSRKAEYVQARRLYQVYEYTNTHKSLRLIGLDCGNIDHATVLHSIKKHLEWSNDKIWQSVKQTFQDNLRKFSPNYSISMTGIRGLLKN